MPSKWAQKRRANKPKEESLPAPVAMSVEELESLLNEVAPEEPTQTIVETVPSVSASLPESPANIHEAVNVFYNNDKRKFQLIKIEYDLNTGMSRIVSVEDYADSQAVVMYKLNGLFANKLIKRTETV